jgi:hypothetical protein
VSRIEVKGDGKKGDSCHPKEVHDEESSKKKTEVQTSSLMKKWIGKQEAE